MNEETKRLFFGIEVHAPWPSALPKGRLLDGTHRHLTLVFLGHIPYAPLLKLLELFPQPSIRLGTAGFFDSCLFLPHRHPHVAAWHAQWWDEHPPILELHSQLSQWLASHHYAIDHRTWKPHVTLCREPFVQAEWAHAFKPLPFYTSHIHLYESKGNLQYIPVWSIPIRAPFMEIEHTADLAFVVYGETLKQLYHHAFTSLAFKVPELLEFFIPSDPLQLIDIIVLLNRVISRADAAIGCPIKAVSFHGEIIVHPDSLLQWEMIIDV